MDDESRLISLFDCTPSSSLYNYSKSLDSIQLRLAEFGLTHNQCKVFIFLGKSGSKTGSEVYKTLNLPRTETYHILNSLQSKGMLLHHLIIQFGFHLYLLIMSSRH